MNGALASRYAAALVDVALEQHDADRVKRDVSTLAEALSSSSDLRTLLESPAVSPELKQQVVAELARRMELAPAVRNFVYLLIDHHRTAMLAEIEGAFQTELNRRLGIAEAALERRTGKKIEAHFRRDPSLVGGTVVRLGSTIYDGSVREQLMRLREQLEGE